MNALWSYLWPLFGLGLIFGILGGTIGFRLPRASSMDQLWEGAPLTPRLRRKRSLALALSAAVSLSAAVVWHGPLGGAERFSTRIERGLHNFLVDNEMTKVTAQLHHDPLSRDVLLSGPADDFQRSELVRLIDQIPGVRRARWASDSGGLPLLAEGLGVCLLGFLLGLLVAYLVELRRRYNAQWNW